MVTGKCSVSKVCRHMLQVTRYKIKKNYGVSHGLELIKSKSARNSEKNVLSVQAQGVR